MSPTQTLVALVVAVTLAAVALGRVPRLRMNRATLALVGAVVLVGSGAVPLEAAYAALDLDTLVLLFALMVVNANLRFAGFFRAVAQAVTGFARTPRQLLAWVVVASGVLSALFLNDTVVLLFTPVVLEVVAATGQRPLPYLMGLATAANVGSVATLVGNPQNMIIGLSSGLSYREFLSALAPVALGGLLLVWGVLALVYRREVTGEALSVAPPTRGRGHRVHRAMFAKTLIVVAGLLAALLAGVEVPVAALAAAAVLLVTRRVKAERVFAEIDLSLLVFFAGLFVVTGALETSGLSARLFAAVGPWAAASSLALTAVAAGLSNLVSNVPAVLLFRPWVPSLADPGAAWLTLAMATTLAGNLTLLGSVANLIVAEGARARGVDLSFGEYLKAGVPITLLTLTWGVVWLSLR